MTDEREENPVETGEAGEAAASSQAEAPSPAQAVDWQRPETWPKEVGGKRGPEPTRYGDWESNGRCSDF